MNDYTTSNSWIFRYLERLILTQLNEFIGVFGELSLETDFPLKLLNDTREAKTTITDETMNI